MLAEGGRHGSAVDGRAWPSASAPMLRGGRRRRDGRRVGVETERIDEVEVADEGPAGAATAGPPPAGPAPAPAGAVPAGVGPGRAGRPWGLGRGRGRRGGQRPGRPGHQRGRAGGLARPAQGCGGGGGSAGRGWRHVRGRRERAAGTGPGDRRGHPRVGRPNRPDEPFGEASNFAKHHLDGQTVRMAGDAEPRDRYGRMLAYVWLEDGTFWNALLAAEGYAQQLTIPPTSPTRTCSAAWSARRVGSTGGCGARSATAAREGGRPVPAIPRRAARAGAATGGGRKRRPAVRGVPVVPQPPVLTPDGAAVARRTCFPRLPCPLGLGRTAQAVLAGGSGPPGTPPSARVGPAPCSPN
jgi:hypothetical protein